MPCATSRKSSLSIEASCIAPDRAPPLPKTYDSGANDPFARRVRTYSRLVLPDTAVMSLAPPKSKARDPEARHAPRTNMRRRFISGERGLLISPAHRRETAVRLYRHGPRESPCLLDHGCPVQNIARRFASFLANPRRSRGDAGKG